MVKQKLEQFLQFLDSQKKKYIWVYWVFGFFFIFFVICLFMFQLEDDMLFVVMFDNLLELLVFVIYVDDGEIEFGCYWKINCISVDYKDIFFYVMDVLIVIEDECFYEYLGVDFCVFGRVVINVGGVGGVFIIMQQLVKQLFIIQMCECEEQVCVSGVEIVVRSGGKWG